VTAAGATPAGAVERARAAADWVHAVARHVGRPAAGCDPG
jgi:hypothetical protein